MSPWHSERSRDGGVDEVALPEGPGRLWLCGKHAVAPDPDALLARLGATTVVALNERHELEDRYPDYVRWLRTSGKAVWHPVPDLHAPTLGEARALIDELCGRIQRGEHVVLHCGAGIGRAGTIAAALLMRAGLSHDEALARVASSRPMAGPEAGAQRELLVALSQGERVDYGSLAARYDEDRARFAVGRDDVIADLVAARSAVRVLDLGCGTGTWLAAQAQGFAGSAVTLLGLDPSVAMLSEARAKGVAVVAGRAADLPLPDGTVDHVVSSFSFHQVTDKARALDEMARVLDPDGVLRITNIDPEAGGWWVYEVFPETIAVDAARFWPAARLVDELEARGFAVEVVRERSAVARSAADALTDAERRVISQLALLDDETYERGVEHLRLLAADPGASVGADAALLRLIARKSG